MSGCLKRCLAFIFMITVITALRNPNVTMEAENTRYILKWEWDQTQANYTMTFTSEYTYSNEDNEESYRTVCYRTAERYCDFSHENLSYSACFLLRVRAEGERERSLWSRRHFCPDEDATLGPPSRVDLQSGEATLKVIITEPLTVYNTPMSTIFPLSYRVHYWEKRTPQRSSTQELNTTWGTLTALKPWTEYCLCVCAFNLEEEKISPNTSTQYYYHDWYIFLSLCCVGLSTLLIFWHRDKIRSFCLHPTLPSSIQDHPPSSMCHLLEPQEETCATLELMAVQALEGPEDRRAEQASAPLQDDSGLDSGISKVGEESDESCHKLLQEPH